MLPRFLSDSRSPTTQTVDITFDLNLETTLLLKWAQQLLFSKLHILVHVDVLLLLDGSLFKFSWPRYNNLEVY